MSEIYVDVAIPATVDKLFTYSVPKEMHDAITPGVRVIAPFGKRTVIGFVIACSTMKPQFLTSNRSATSSTASPAFRRIA